MPALAIAAWPILVPVVLTLGPVWMFCAEMRGPDLPDLEARPANAPAPSQLDPAFAGRVSADGGYGRL